jgi:hypothetical protein
MKWKRFPAVQLVFFSSALSLVAAPADAGEVYVIDARIIAIPLRAEESVTIVSAPPDSRAAGVPRGLEEIATGVTELHLGALSITFGEGGEILWNGTPGLPEERGIEVLSEPRLRTEPGQEVVVRAGSRLQYFEPLGEGRFAVRVTDPELAPGLELRCTARPTQNGRVILDYDLRLVVLAARMRIPGVSLDVGKPILRTRQVAHQVLVDLDRWSVIASRMAGEDGGDRDDVLLFLLRVGVARA